MVDRRLHAFKSLRFSPPLNLIARELDWWLHLLDVTDLVQSRFLGHPEAELAVDLVEVWQEQVRADWHRLGWRVVQLLG